MHASSQGQETIVRLVPGGEHSLSHLADDELLSSTRRLVGASNQLFAQLLLHLAEVETRGIHRTRACASLYTYCIYELRLSEDAAARRSSAARLVKRFPLLFDAIASGDPDIARTAVDTHMRGAAQNLLNDGRTDARSA